MAATQPKRTAPYPEFAQRLGAGMTKAGVRAVDVAKELAVDQETIRLWMRGERMPRDPKLKRLAKMIGVEPSVLRYGPEKSVAAFPQLRGEHVTDEDELHLLQAYRGLGKEWAKDALRRRAVELLEEFGRPGAENPWKVGRASS